jgi:selenocysteine lyase/cysteine desulfurase
MKMDRKNFIRHLGVGAAGLAMGPGLGRAREAVARERSDPAPDSENYWQAIRAQYPLEDDPLYLNTGGLGPAPQPVLDAVTGTMHQLQLHSETGHERFEPAREKVARFVGASPDEICFTRNATEANSIIAAGLALREGDEVIFCSHAHPGGSFPWLNQARQRGVRVRQFEPDAGSEAGNVARIRELMSPRTRVIQVSHVTCTTGLVMPVREIAELAHARDCWFHIDGAQSVGMIPVDLAAIGCDSYAFSGHKWLGGPHETGALFLRRDRLDDVAPTGIGAYSGEITTQPGELTYRRAAARHEYGTRSAAAIVGLAEAVRWQEAIGRERIAARGRELSSQLMEALAATEGIEVLTPKNLAMRASIITVRHPRADAGRLFGYLLKEHRLRCRPVTEQNLQAVRISTHIFNSHSDCLRIGSAVRASVRAL